MVRTQPGIRSVRQAILLTPTAMTVGLAMLQLARRELLRVLLRTVGQEARATPVATAARVVMALERAMVAEEGMVARQLAASRPAKVGMVVGQASMVASAAPEGQVASTQSGVAVTEEAAETGMKLAETEGSVATGPRQVRAVQAEQLSVVETKEGLVATEVLVGPWCAREPATRFLGFAKDGKAGAVHSTELLRHHT